LNIGILGGSFDPIHSGHAYLARTALRIFSLDEVVIMPARTPPHKSGQGLTNPYHRFAMASLATNDIPEVVVSTWELDRPGPTYTIDTLKHFSSNYPRNSYWFIAGGDSLKELHLWKDCDKLLREYSFIFFERAGVQTSIFDLDIPHSMKEKFQTVCETRQQLIQPDTSYLVQSIPPPVSSTDIRQMIASGLTPGSDILSAQVLEHIRKHRLYEQRERDSG